MKSNHIVSYATWSILLLFIFLSVFICCLILGCEEDNDKDDEEDNNSFTSGPCSSIYEPQGDLNLHDFEISGQEDCAEAGIDIEINSFNYSEYRTVFTGTGTYSSENGPHYILSWNQNAALCYIELTQGGFQFSDIADSCTAGLTIYVYSIPPVTRSFDGVICSIKIHATAEGLEECELGP